MPPFSPEALLQAIVDSADDAIISKSLDGIITSWNRGAERVFGYRAEEVVGGSVLKLLPADRVAEETEILARLRRGETIDHFESVRVRKNGELFPVSLTISPIRDDSGQIVGASKVARDISVQNRVAELNALLGAIVDSSDDAIVSKNLEGIVTSWNRGAERIFGYSAAEMIGQPIWRLFPPDRLDEEPHILERIKRGDRVDHFETKRVHKDGRELDVSVTISPVRDRLGHVIGASKIAREITAQRVAQEKLVEANRELRQADDMKSEFLSTLSHELRTPLNAILGWTQVLKETGFEAKEDLAEAVDVIERNARAQATMIEDLLDVSRIVSGKVMLDIEELDLVKITEAAMQAMRPAAMAKEIQLTSAFATISPIVRGDEDRMQQVVWNLLSNAIKFTPKGGRVHVTIGRVNSHVEIAVADNGPGIKPEFLPHIFERFRQADASTKRQFGGLGLGLSIVKHLMELHGGDVRALSPGEGLGSTFVVTLPVVSVRRQETSARAAGAPAEEDAATRSPLLDGVEVLVVDDEPDSLTLIKRILTGRGAHVQTAGSVKEALGLLESYTPDLLLSDISMPEQDGFDLIRRVRELPVGRLLPAVAVTAMARSEDRTRALKAGFQTHIAKPVEPTELIAVVASFALLRRSKRA